MNVLTRTARNLISRFGTTITLSNPSAGSYDAGSGEMINPTSATPTQVKASIMDATLSKQNFEVQSGDLAVTIRGDKFTPTVGTELLISEARYKAVKVVSIFAGEDIALYEIQGRLI